MNIIILIFPFGGEQPNKRLYPATKIGGQADGRIVGGGLAGHRRGSHAGRYEIVGAIL